MTQVISQKLEGRTTRNNQEPKEGKDARTKEEVRTSHFRKGQEMIGTFFLSFR